MATYAQTPGLLNIKAVTGAHFSCQLDFDTSLVGYTFDSAIVLQEYPTKREQAITVTVDNAAQGIITLSLTQGQTTSLGVFSKKKWYLNWNISGIKQTILAGNFELSDIPLGQNEVVSTGITINTQDVNITLSAFSNAALDGKQPLNAALTQISGLSPNNDDFLQRKAGAWTNRSIAQVKTDLAITNVDNTSDANKPISTATQTALNLKLDSSTAASTYQPLDSDLTAIAGIVATNGDFIQRESGTWTNKSSAQVRSALSINNVDNTSDLNKPISTATQTALDLKLDTSTAASTYQPLDADLTSIAELSPSNDDIIQRKSGAWTNRTIPQFKTDLGISAFGGTLIDDADATTARATLGLGSVATQNFTPISGGVLYSGASSIQTSSAGTIGQVLQSNGAGAPTWSSLTNLSVGTAAAAIINNDNSTNREYFPVFAYQSTGTASLLYGSSTKLKFNPSNGYFTADGGFVADQGNLELRDSGIHWNGQIIFDAEGQSIYDFNGTDMAVWGTNGMYVTGTASKDVPLRLMDTTAGNLATGSYIIVRPSASATTNGTELRNAYAAAKTFTPNSLALSATNRATVLLLPGRYDLGTTPLTMDTEFVDLVGLSEEPRHVFITSQVIVSDSGTIVQTADNVVIRNVSIDRTGAPAGSGAGRTAAYFPNRTSTAIQSWTSNGTLATVASNGHGLQNGDSVRITGSGNTSFDGVYTITRIDDNSFTFPSTVNSSGLIGTATERFDDTYIENCRFSGDSSSGMRQAVEYAGTYRRCVGGGGSFGGTYAGSGSSGAIASGLFEDCIGGGESFGVGTASGTFTRCTGGTISFGGTASGTFTDCSASGNGFAMASGTFLRCSASGDGFGAGFSTATGTLTECTWSASSSLGYTGTFTGTMRRCRFVATSGNAAPIRVGAGAKIFDSTLIATGTGNSITAGSAVTISLAGCRMNRDINANVSNNLGTLTESYNLIDADIT